MSQNAVSLDRDAELRACLDRLRNELQLLDSRDCNLAAVYLATACDALEAEISEKPIA